VCKSTKNDCICPLLQCVECVCLCARSVCVRVCVTCVDAMTVAFLGGVVHCTQVGLARTIHVRCIHTR